MAKQGVGGGSKEEMAESGGKVADVSRKVADVGSKKHSLVVSGNISGTVLEPSFKNTNDFSRWRQ